MISTSVHEHLLSGSALEAFGRELDAVRSRVVATLGEHDVQYMLRTMTVQRRAELAGRALLCAGVLPPAFVAGVALLSWSKVLETMEIGHNVLHGQYDWTNEPALASGHYEWDWACPASHWRYAHNYVHHTFTNIVGKDRDVGYGLLRMADEQPWHWLRLFQPIYAAFQALSFEWAVAVHHLAFDDVLSGEKSLRSMLRDAKPVVRKAWRQLVKEYLAYPLLAGPFAPIVVFGNLTANTIRSVWAFSVIFCGHFSDGVRTYREDECEGESRGAFYQRQIRGSANIDGSPHFHKLTGHLSYQVEHHLFPDLPVSRYPEISVDVRHICAKYGVPYNSSGFGHQLRGALKRVVRCALPTRSGPSH